MSNQNTQELQHIQGTINQVLRMKVQIDEQIRKILLQLKDETDEQKIQLGLTRLQQLMQRQLKIADICTKGFTNALHIIDKSEQLVQSARPLSQRLKTKAVGMIPFVKPKEEDLPFLFFRLVKALRNEIPRIEIYFHDLRRLVKQQTLMIRYLEPRPLLDQSMFHKFIKSQKQAKVLLHRIRGKELTAEIVSAAQRLQNALHRRKKLMAFEAVNASIPWPFIFAGLMGPAFASLGLVAEAAPVIYAFVVEYHSVVQFQPKI